MNIIIQSSLHTLNKSKTLLSSLSNNDLCNSTVSPYYSCIGSHIRHILDFYDCIFEGLSTLNIDLTNRSRDLRMHEDCDYAMDNVLRVISSLNNLTNEHFENSLIVEDDLGLGRVKIEYKLGAILAQANSHAIHHYAIINYILDRLGISLNDDTFGYNPTTPKSKANFN